MLIRWFKGQVSKATWRAAHAHVKTARRHVATPKRWGQPEERYAYHFQFAHIDGERLLRGLPALIAHAERNRRA